MVNDPDIVLLGASWRITFFCIRVVGVLGATDIALVRIGGRAEETIGDIASLATCRSGDLVRRARTGIAER